MYFGYAGDVNVWYDYIREKHNCSYEADFILALKGDILKWTYL